MINEKAQKSQGPRLYYPLPKGGRAESEREAARERGGSTRDSEREVLAGAWGGVGGREAYMYTHRGIHFPN